MTFMGVHGKVWVEGRLQGYPLRGGQCPELVSCPVIQPQVIHCRSKPSPPVRLVWLLWKHIKKEQKTLDKGREKGWETTEGTLRSEEDKKEKVPQVLEWILPAAHGDPALGADFLQDSACGEAMPEPGKWQRETALHWPQMLLHRPCDTSGGNGGVCIEGMMLSWEEGGGNVLL